MPSDLWMAGWFAAAAVVEDNGEGVLAEELVGNTAIRTVAAAVKAGVEREDAQRLKRVFAKLRAEDARFAREVSDG